jgi:hypothetical protein
MRYRAAGVLVLAMVFMVAGYVNLRTVGRLAEGLVCLAGAVVLSIVSITAMLLSNISKNQPSQPGPKEGP